MINGFLARSVIIAFVLLLFNTMPIIAADKCPSFIKIGNFYKSPGIKSSEFEVLEIDGVWIKIRYNSGKDDKIVWANTELYPSLEEIIK